MRPRALAFVAAGAALLALAGCATAQQAADRCTSLGYPEGSAAFLSCYQTERNAEVYQNQQAASTATGAAVAAAFLGLLISR